jgi:hypothetical protein
LTKVSYCSESLAFKTWSYSSRIWLSRSFSMRSQIKPT